MKSIYLCMSLFMVLCCLPLVAQEDNLEAEKETIKNICMELTLADASGDDYTVRSHLTDEYEYLQAVSVNETAQGSAWHRKLDPAEKPEKPKEAEPFPFQFENEDYVFHINGDLAWVSFNQKVSESAPGRDILWTRRVNFTLRKEDDAWKVVAVAAIGTGCNDPKLFHVKQKLTDLSHRCIQAKDTEKAIRIAELALELFPESAHAYDALAWAYYNHGDKEKTIEYAQKALDQLPNDTFTPPRWHDQIKKWAEEKFERVEQME